MDRQQPGRPTGAVDAPAAALERARDVLTDRVIEGRERVGRVRICPGGRRGLAGRAERAGGTDPKWIREVKNLGQELALGANYYLNKHALKVQASWIVRTPRDTSFDSSDHLVAVQLDATF